MKKYVRRAGVLLLAAVMILAFTACSESTSGTQNATKAPAASDSAAATASTSDDASGYKLYDKPTTWSILVPTFVNAPRKGDQLVYTELAKVTNVSLDMQEGGSGADYTTKINLLMASDEMPNIIVSDIGTMQNYLQDGQIIDLTSYVQKSAPHYLAELSKDDGLKRNATSSDGKFWYFSKIRWAHDSTTAMINKPWLDKLGLKVPTTVDELTKALEAFKTLSADKVPWTAGGWGGAGGVPMFAFLTFNTYNGFKLFDDGQYQYGPLERADQYKQALQWLNKLYTEKVLDNQYLTISNDEYVAMVRKDQVGFVYGWCGASTEKVDASGNMIIPATTDWVTQPPVKGPDGKQISSRPGILSSQTFITKSHPDPEKAARYFDYGYTDAGCLLHCWGVEGVTYNVKNGEKVFIDDILNSASPMNTARNYGIIAEGWPGLQREVIPGLYPQYLMDSINANKPYWEPVQPVIIGTADEEKTIAGIMVDVNKLVSESQAKFIAGDLNFEQDWDNFQNQLKNSGVQDVINMRKTQYQAWKSK